MQLSEQDFQVLMDNIDRALIDGGIRVPARPIQAILRILQANHCSGPLANPCDKSLHYPVVAKNLHNHVHHWYELRYGTKLNIDWSPGKFPVLIESEIYFCRLPLVVGREFLVLSSKNRFTDRQILNAVDFILDLPEFVRSRLDQNFECELQVAFIIAIEVTKELSAKKFELLRMAKTDIELSCDCLSRRDINLSLSAWHSLQFAEKVLKAYISEVREYKRDHNIEALRDEAIACGYIPDNTIMWDLFKFKPGVRYEADKFTLSQAIEINHEAWKIGYNILRQ